MTSSSRRAKCSRFSADGGQHPRGQVIDVDPKRVTENSSPSRSRSMRCWQPTAAQSIESPAIDPEQSRTRRTETGLGHLFPAQDGRRDDHRALPVLAGERRGRGTREQEHDVAVEPRIPGSVATAAVADRSRRAAW